MNKARRAEIAGIISNAQRIKTDPDIEAVRDELEELHDDIDSVLMDEQMYMESVPENLQGSARYEAAEEAEENLSEAVDAIDDLDMDDLDMKEVCKTLDEVIKLLGCAMNV